MLENLNAEYSPADHRQLARAVRAYAGEKASDTENAEFLFHPKVQAVAKVLADLIDQQWNFEISENGLWLKRATLDEKVIREQLLARRNASLAVPSVSRFLDECESPSKLSAKKSIRLLIHDGSNLASQIQNVVDENIELEKVIRPIIQPVISGEKDKFTGQYLTDIWRYCRLTWSLEYHSIPGRQMPYLIRNGAQPGQPIMGIGSLASPVLQHALRDNWIGWSYDAIATSVATGRLKVEDLIAQIDDALEFALSNLYLEDLEVNSEILQNPTFQDIYTLETIASDAQNTRLKILKSEEAEKYRKKVTPSKMTDAEILSHSQSPLFRAKRAARLAKILETRRQLQKIHALPSKFQQNKALMTSKEGRSAIGFTIGEIRTIGTSSRVADLNVCGAIPPYNHLLGGKLVALSVFSDEIQKAYRDRYRSAESEIATFMAGRRIFRPTNLEVITTTSLYGEALSQYHGIRLKTSRHRELVHDCEWKRLGLTDGEGTFQFSDDTNEALKHFQEDKIGYRQVNNVFGEGTSPKMRNLRTALGSLGYDADELMKHNQKRLFLAAELGTDSRQRLKNTKLKNATKRSKFRQICKAWMDHWVRKRITNPDIADRIRSESFEKLASQLRPNSYDKQYKRL